MKTDKQTLAAGTTRLHGLDAVRAFALLLGVVLHATMSFFPGPRLWLVDDSESSVLMSALFFVIHMLRMLTFFLIAGFVARLSLHKLGARAFFTDRLRRIGVPLVIGWPILFAALMAAAGMLPYAIRSFSFAQFPLIHLWFLYLLGLFYLAAALLHALCNWRHWPVAQLASLKRRSRNGNPHRPREGGDPWHLRLKIPVEMKWVGSPPSRGRWSPRRMVAASGRLVHVLLQPWAVVLLAAPLCLSLYLQPYWMMWFGIPTPDHSFVPNLPAVIGYGGAFMFGWQAQRRPDALGLWERRWLLNLAIACACTAACLLQAGATPLLMPVPQGDAKLLFAACYSVGAWSWALALIGIGQRFLSHYSATRRYLADASYWIYLIHLPLVVFLQALVSQFAWPWPLKFLVILAAAFVVMLLTYALFVRRTVVGIILNGRKKA